MPKPQSEPDVIQCPFVIAVDSNESAPFHFTGVPIDGDPHGRHWIVETVKVPLYAMMKRAVLLNGNVHLKGLADYSICGLEGRFQIERKSKVDLYGTLGQRRDEFEAEIKRLNEDCDYAAVIVEADWESLLRQPPNSQVLPKVVSRTVLSWSIRYPRVHWWMCMNRRHAELVAFHLMMRFWKLNNENSEESKAADAPETH